MLKPRLEKFYEKIVCEDLILLYNFKTISGLTQFERAILNTTSNKFTSNHVSVMQSFCAWLLGTGQKSKKTRARKSIASFETRKSNLLGLKVTCRKKNMFILLDKLLVWVLPRLVSTTKRSPTLSASTLPSKLIPNKRFLGGGCKSSIYITSPSGRGEAMSNIKFPGTEKEEALHSPLVSEALDVNRIFTDATKRVKNFSQNALIETSNSYFDERLLSEGSPRSLFNKLEEVLLTNNYKNRGLPECTARQTLWLQANRCKGDSQLIESQCDLSAASSTFKHMQSRLLKDKKRVSKEKQNRSFFVISYKSALNFPEITQLNAFFDFLPGFNLSYSLLHQKGGFRVVKVYETFEENRLNESIGVNCMNNRSTFDEVKKECPCINQEFKKTNSTTKRPNESHLKRQFISAFQYPEIFVETNLR